MAETSGTPVLLTSTTTRPLVLSLARDIALNTAIPVACYYLSKRFVSPSELTALLIATAFPTLKSIYDLIRDREIDPVAAVVLLGIVTSIVALYLGGDPRVLLVRESFFTGAFGVACLVSLAFPRPIMFYFARRFIAGREPERRAIFDSRWSYPIFRRSIRIVTAVWGVVYLGEFLVRVALVYGASTAVVLAVSPFLTGVATIAAIVWSFRYARKTRDRMFAPSSTSPIGSDAADS
ncbi:MAG TPA: VC0807 family protein [Gemmatimonadaceae bacterium]|nr:VC0807 family protein [Gemmatimonadaceae bacterium]